MFSINMSSVNLSLFLFSWVIQTGLWIILNYLYYIIVYSKAIGIFMLERKNLRKISLLVEQLTFP